jgi:hypothetical protein
MDGQAPAEKLRAAAALFPEHIHLVVMADSSINSVAILRASAYLWLRPGFRHFDIT